MVLERNKSSKTQYDYFNIQDLKSNLKKHAIRGGGITVFAQMVNFLIQTISTIVLARILTPEEFGLVVMVTALGGFLLILKDFGLTDAIIQATNINHKQISTLFWINVVATFFVVLIVIASSSLIAWFYSEPRLTNITIVWSMLFIFGALSTQHIALLKRRMLFFEVFANGTAAAIISNTLAIILALNGWSYWALVIRQIVRETCITVGAWILCRWRPSLPSLRSDIQSMIVFGRNATGSFITGYFSRNLDEILIGWRYGAIQLGYYHRAYYLFVLPTTQLTEALKNVATSTLSKLRYEPSKYRNYYLNAISIMSFIGMPMSFFFIMESENLVLLLFGSQWEQTIDIFRILAAGTGVWLIYSTKYWLHASLGRSDRLIRWGIIDLIVTSVAILLGLNYGPKGIALAYTIALYLLTGFGIKYAGEPIDLKFRSIVYVIWRYFAAALIAWILCWYVIHLFGFAWHRLVRLIVSLPLYASLYLILVSFFYGSMQPIKNVIHVIREMLPNKVLQAFKY